MDEKDKVAEGQSFYNEALTGSGTINRDGSIGAPLPDPTVLRGGPGGERTSPGGVERPLAATLVPPAVEASDTKAIEGAGGKTPFTRKATGSTSK